MQPGNFTMKASKIRYHFIRTSMPLCPVSN